MRICLLYTCVTNGPLTADFAARFVSAYHAYPPGIEHETIFVCNGGPTSSDVGLICSMVPGATFMARSNEGQDIGGYIDAARGPAKDADWIVCMGESVYAWQPRWLSRIAECLEQKGPGMFGPFSSNTVRAHLNTTMFATKPGLLTQYPLKIGTRAERYQFEHGEQSFWRWLKLMGKSSWLVTWDGCWRPEEWRGPRNIMWRGDQSNLVMKCNHSDKFDAAPVATRAGWQRYCDQPFK